LIRQNHYQIGSPLLDIVFSLEETWSPGGARSKKQFIDPVSKLSTIPKLSTMLW